MYNGVHRPEIISTDWRSKNPKFLVNVLCAERWAWGKDAVSQYYDLLDCRSVCSHLKEKSDDTKSESGRIHY